MADETPAAASSIIKIGNTEIKPRNDVVADNNSYDLARMADYFSDITIRLTESGSYKNTLHTPTVQMYIKIDWQKLSEDSRKLRDGQWLKTEELDSAMPKFADILTKATGVHFESQHELLNNTTLSAEMTTVEYSNAMKVINEALIAQQQMREAAWERR